MCEPERRRRFQGAALHPADSLPEHSDQKHHHKNSANWAINCRYCSTAKVDSVSIFAGHDGLHTRFCDGFTVTRCDFRTGDDAFAGNDNRDFVVRDCKINTSCNGFRMGCMNLTVKNCLFWGPGEYVHKIQKRNNMLSAFVHFSPKDENPKLQSGNWLIEDITVKMWIIFTCTIMSRVSGRPDNRQQGLLFVMYKQKVF
ncbi:MAG: hypothetical protein HC906_08735 [Bacteroidales bacterium]|nr:hypothetical protein [Bacteroidales bacterium]